jgi:hypothetical protein
LHILWHNVFNRFWSMFPHVDLAWKRLFLIRWECTSPWNVFCQVKKAANWLTKQFCRITMLSPASGGGGGIALKIPCSHSETSKTLTALVVLDINLIPKHFFLWFQWEVCSYRPRKLQIQTVWNLYLVYRCWKLELKISQILSQHIVLR